MTKEELLEELAERAEDAAVKRHYGLGGEYAGGYLSGFSYALLWSGVADVERIDAVVRDAYARAHTGLKAEGREIEALTPEDAGIEALDLLGRLVAMVNTNYDPETMRSTGVVAHARRLLERAGAWPPSGAQS